VDVQDVAAPEAPVARDPVADDVVDGRADRLREAAVIERRGHGGKLVDDVLVTDAVQLVGRDARAHVLGDHIEHVGRQPPGDTHLVLFFRRLYRDGHGVGWGVSARGAFVAQRLLWYKARAFQANQRHTRAAHPSAGCLARRGARSLRGRVEVQPETRSLRWP